MRRYLEDAESIALMDWAKRVLYNGKPISEYLMHVPNGGKRNAREAARFKRMGVRAGFPDYFLHVVRLKAESVTPSGGLMIELKGGEHPRLTESQLIQLSHLQICGYETRVCHGWVAAAREICQYLGLPCSSPG